MSRFIHGVARIRTSSLCLNFNAPLCVCRVLLIHPSVDGHLGCLDIVYVCVCERETVVSHVAVNILCVDICFQAILVTYRCGFAGSYNKSEFSFLRGCFPKRLRRFAASPAASGGSRGSCDVPSSSWCGARRVVNLG